MTGANQHQAHLELVLRLVFERSPDAILLLDDGVFIDCNQAAVDMLCAAGKKSCSRSSKTINLVPSRGPKFP